MSDVAGMYELGDLSNYAGNDHPDWDELAANVKRLEALLRNRQELVEMIVIIRALRDAGMLGADNIDELYAKAKELDND